MAQQLRRQMAIRNNYNPGSDSCQLNNKKRRTKTYSAEFTAITNLSDSR
jgi:hypothetical protein